MDNFDVVRNALSLVERLIDLSIDVGDKYESADANDYAVMYNRGFDAGMFAAKDIVMAVNQSFSPYTVRPVMQSENTEES